MRGRNSLTDKTVELLNMGKDYPLGYKYFQERLHQAFASQAHLQDDDEIRMAIKKAEYVRKGWSSSISIIIWMALI